MTTKTPHQPLREYIAMIRGVIDKDDTFGNYLTRLVYRESKANVNGLFRRVRAVYDAVAAAGGNLTDARAWTAKSVRWWRTGKAIDQKYARFEADPAAARAMDDLLSFLATLPEDLLKATPPEPPAPASSPFGAKPGTPPAPPSNPFTRKPATPPAITPPLPGTRPFSRPAPPPPSPFGKPATPAPTSPFGQKPGSPPSAPATSNPFGTRPAFPALDPLPFQVAACFDILGIAPDSPKPPTPKTDQNLPAWLANAVVEEEKQPIPEKPPLPDDLKGLIERLVNCAEDAEEAVRILHKIGSLNDMRVIDYLHNLLRGLGETDTLVEMFAEIGGDVGVAGLLTMLPVVPEKREAWLLALLAVVREVAANGRSLSNSSMSVIWDIAVAESAMDVVFTPTALRLLAMTGRREALPILWDHYTSQEISQRRAALFAIAQLDPGDKLPYLLMGIENLGDANTTPASPFGAAVEAPVVGIPFEKLEAVLYDSGLSKPKAAALLLISYMQDDRVVPLLIAQLARRIPRLREVALNQLRRLGAKSAADAIAELMKRDDALRRTAANVLCAWEDPRCVPVLLPKAQAEKAEETVSTIRWLGHLAHPHFDQWLGESIDLWLAALDALCRKEPSDPGDINTMEDSLVSILDMVANRSARNLPLVIDKIVKVPSIKLKLAVVSVLGKLSPAPTPTNPSAAPGVEDRAKWGKAKLRDLVLEDSPIVSYRAALVCEDEALAYELTHSSSEVKRLIGTRILWNLKDAAGLIDCVRDRSAAVRDAAIWSLGHISGGGTAQIEALRSLIDTEDHLDIWNMNPAMLAWRGLAKQGALSTSA